jgi:hypothetical protein
MLRVMADDRKYLPFIEPETLNNRFVPIVVADHEQ